jgi:hypothetical protein
MEVGTKALTKGDKEDAEDLFKKSFDLYNLFWGLNLGVIDTKDAGKGKTDLQSIALLSEDEPPAAKQKMGVFDKLGAMVKKAIDCCIE